MIDLGRFRRVFGLLGPILIWFSLVFVFPLSFALFDDTTSLPFVLPGLLSMVAGSFLYAISTNRELEVEDGFLLVVLTWVTVGLLGAIPFYVSGIGSVATPMNAVFESISGFTCTGSTVMLDISLEKYPRSLMFWRQMTQWLGGMGILVLAVWKVLSFFPFHRR